MNGMKLTIAQITAVSMLSIVASPAQAEMSWQTYCSNGILYRAIYRDGEPSSTYESNRTVVPPEVAARICKGKITEEKAKSTRICMMQALYKSVHRNGEPSSIYNSNRTAMTPEGAAELCATPVAKKEPVVEYAKIAVANTCHKPIDMVVYYRNPEKEWTLGFANNISKDTRASVITNGDLAQSNNNIFYFYGLSKDKTLKWSGDDLVLHSENLDRTYNLAKTRVLSKNGLYTISVNCDAARYGESPVKEDPIVVNPPKPEPKKDPWTVMQERQDEWWKETQKNHADLHRRTQEAHQKRMEQMERQRQEAIREHKQMLEEVSGDRSTSDI